LAAPGVDEEQDTPDANQLLYPFRELTPTAADLFICSVSSVGQI